VVHAVDDPMPPFAGARRMAEQIPAARFLAIESGGHLLLGYQDLVRAQIATFISDHAPSFAVAIGNHSAKQPPPAFVGRFSPNRPVDIRQPGDIQRPTESLTSQLSPSSPCCGWHLAQP
jgi:hypothetical protein